MKRFLISLVLSSLVVACAACQRTELSVLPIDAGCTVVYATDGEQHLGGGNADWDDPFTRIWFLPGENGDNSRVYLGYENLYPQGGMNDQGLFFDWLAVEDQQIDVPQNGKEYVGGSLIDRIMRECGTVDCVIEYFGTYQLANTWSFQLLFGDAFGNSVIIEPLTVIRQEGSYQVATNFYQSETDPELADCWRYNKATDLLENNTDLSVEFIRDVLDGVHFEGFWGIYTMYSYVYDLKEQVVYLYNFHDYENVVVFHLSEELAQGPHAYEIPALFPENPEWEQWAKPIIDRYDLLVESNIDSSISPTIYDAYVGTYLVPDDLALDAESMSVVADGISLWLTFPTGHQYEFFPRSETSFFQVARTGRKISSELSFYVGEDGKATHLEIAGNETKYTFERLSDDILYDFTPLLQSEKPAGAGKDALDESASDQGAAPILLWIALGGVSLILLAGGGLYFVLRSKRL